jgi:uncharacterized protein (DUF362 family)/NAD-dependent dihydropyrimidine dehydrogenase PreA subunit
MEGEVNRSTVALVRCTTYDPDVVYGALRRGVELLGGVDRFVSPGERILLKPNILAGEGPECAVTTHPSVLEGTIRLLQEGGAQVRFGDSPGLDNPVHAAKRSGLLEAGIRTGAELAEFSIGSRMDNPGGALASSFPIAQAVHECDGIINLPKMKAHQLTRITGAVKNLFGCIPGKRKALYHVQFQDVEEFSGLLVELGQRLRPRLHVMDGIVAMEGNGPRSGDPRTMRVLIMSHDPVAVDATFCRLVAMDPTFVPTTVVGHQRGLGQYQQDQIELVGDPLESLADAHFKVIRKPVYSNASYAHYNIIKNAVLPRPVIDAHNCVKCGRCVEACPVPDKALRFDNGRKRPPRYHYDLCIRCYCCHEMCPERAIDKKTPLLGRILQLG